ncbi:MAG: flavodoxin family protein [Bacillota bacterium]|nr:flavodoxin family protein [Bacillota bacterium]
MKIVLLSGSPRPDGNTMQVLEACAEAIRAQGVEAELLSLAGKEIRSCIACRKCRETKDCILQDDALELFRKIEQADGFIVGAPVYYGTVRGDVMNFVQRLSAHSAHHGRFLDGMVGGPVVVGRRGGHTASIQELLMFCFISGMIVPGSTYWNMVFGREAGEAMEDTEGLEHSVRFATRCAELAKRLRG